MEKEPTTICAVATPRGAGALGVLRLSGPDALAILQTLCQRKRFRPRKMYLQALREKPDGPVLDQALVCFFQGPRSYTGEDMVEVYAHGGVLNLARIQDLLLQRGAQLAAPGEFTRRAFLNGRLDLTQAEAVEQIIQARSQRALANAQAVLQGALGSRVQALRQNVVSLTAELEAHIDFADDLDSEPPWEALRNQVSCLSQEVVRLAQTFGTGRRLNGARVGLWGPVNAGKSSLFNALLEQPRALVSQQPGTTRDYLEAELWHQGQRVLLVDTAGVRDAGHLSQLEQAGIDAAEPVLAQCDLLLWVADLGTPDPEYFFDLAQKPSSAAATLVVANKIDLAAPGALERLTHSLGADVELVATSASNGQGIAELKQTLFRLLFDFADQEAGEQVQVTLERHHAHLTQASQALTQASDALDQQLPPELVVEHARDALNALGIITGETYTEAVLDSVFARFCIGK